MQLHKRSMAQKRLRPSEPSSPWWLPPASLAWESSVTPGLWASHILFLLPALPGPPLFPVGSHCVFMTWNITHSRKPPWLWSPRKCSLISLCPLKLSPFSSPPLTLITLHLIVCLSPWMVYELFDSENPFFHLWYPVPRVLDMLIISTQLWDLWCRDEWAGGWMGRWIIGWTDR